MNPDPESSIIPYPHDEALLTPQQDLDFPVVIVYRFPERAVVLGRASKPEVELFLHACIHDKIPLYRRRGGGCAVVLDEGMISVGLRIRSPGPPNITALFRTLSTWMVDCLARVGYRGLSQAGYSDLVLGDRKIGGACLYRSRDQLLYSISLLIDPHLDLMDRYLRHPPREPAYRAGRSHRHFVMGLEPHCQPSRMDRIIDDLKTVAQEGLPRISSSLEGP